jgi:hypothetical protein
MCHVPSLSPHSILDRRLHYHMQGPERSATPAQGHRNRSQAQAANVHPVSLTGLTPGKSSTQLNLYLNSNTSSNCGS